MRPSKSNRKCGKMEFKWCTVTGRLFINVIQTCDLLRMLVRYNVRASDRNTNLIRLVKSVTGIRETVNAHKILIGKTKD